MIPVIENGLLPPGIWDCTLDEIAEVFTKTTRRAAPRLLYVETIEPDDRQLPL